MTKATTKIKYMEVDKEKAHAESLKELETLLIENKDLIEKSIEVLRLLDEHEVLNLTRAGLNKSDKALTRVLNALIDNDITSSIQNVLLMTEIIGKLDIENVEKTVLKVNQGVIDASLYEEKSKKDGWLGLLKVLNDPHFIEGSNTLLSFVKAFGYTTDELKEKQNIKSKVNTFSPKPSTSKQSESTNNQLSSNKKWIAATTIGLSTLVTAAYVFKK